MLSYFIRRLLIVPPTLLVITLLVFGLSRMMPGGPLERLLSQAAMASEDGGGAGQSGKSTLGEDEIEEVEELYGLNKPAMVAYMQWLGVWSKEIYITKKEFGGDAGEKIGSSASDPSQVIELSLKGTGELVTVTKLDGDQVRAVFRDGVEIRKKGWKTRYETEADRQLRYRKRNRLTEEEQVPGYKPRVVIYKTSFSGLLQGDLGRSILYGDSVMQMIMSRVPVATYFGILAAFITYGVSLPLGVLKAIKHLSLIHI